MGRKVVVANVTAPEPPIEERIAAAQKRVLDAEKIYKRYYAIADDMYPQVVNARQALKDVEDRYRLAIEAADAWTEQRTEAYQELQELLQELVKQKYPNG